MKYKSVINEHRNKYIGFLVLYKELVVLLGLTFEKVKHSRKFIIVKWVKI